MLTIVWRRVDVPGHEATALYGLAEGWRLTGSAALTHDGRPARLDYEIRCDPAWHTRSALVTGWIGSDEVELVLTRDEQDQWRVNGAPAPAVDGCHDVDLGFSPSTNLLPIRRLRLTVGGEAAVRAAWVRFPELTVEPLEQTYRRLDARRYAYESAGGAFRRTLEVSGAGFVTSYPGLWEAESLGGDHGPNDGGP